MPKIIETPVLETKRLILEPIALKHAKDLEKHFNNWNIIKDLTDRVPWPYPEGGVAKHLKADAFPRMAKGVALLWALVLKSNPNEAIGRLDFRLEKWEDDQEERGFWLAEPYWGQGLMTEAVSCLNDYVFNVLGRDKMTVQNYKDNIGSHRIKEKTGATLLEVKKSKWRGQDREIEIWELTAGNWKKFKAENL